MSQQKTATIPSHDRTDVVAGLLLGSAIGDALGVPREGLSRRRAARLFGDSRLRHSFVFGRGMVSDDTEHACIVGQALLQAPKQADDFARALGWGLRWWLLGLPAGAGRATLRAIVRLWIGFSPSRSGVYSAGNGPAMRAGLLGVCLGHEPDRLRQYLQVSTRLTHIDPRAERGALLVALGASHGAECGPDGVNAGNYFAGARMALRDVDAELAALLDQVETHLRAGSSPAAFADALGLNRGVSGYIYHTVPVALFCWLRSPQDFRGAVEAAITLGGDADTTGAIVGALCGATVGAGGLPLDWLDGLWDWPRSVAWMRALSARLAKCFPDSGPGVAAKPLQLFWPALLPRNLVFLLVTMMHVLRRLLPPY